MTGSTRRQLLTRVVGAGAGLVAVSFVSACGGQSPTTSAPSVGTAVSGGTRTVDPNSRLGKLIGSKTIRVGFNPIPPFCYIGPDGKLTGFSPEALRTVFGEIGITNLEPVEAEFSALIPSLVAGSVDAVAAGLYINSARCAQVAFGNPDYKVGDGFIVKKGNPKNLHSYADVAKSDATLCTVQGSAVVNTAKAAGVPDARIQLVPGNTEGFAAIVAGRVDCYATSRTSVANLLNVNRDQGAVEAATPFNDPPDPKTGKPIKNHGAVAFRPADTDLVAAYNEGLAKALASGAILANLKKFGLSEAELPDKEATAASLCR